MSDGTKKKNITLICTLKPEEELKHYGVLGMKWGVRKYKDVRERGAGSISQLNKLSKYQKKTNKLIDKKQRKGKSTARLEQKSIKYQQQQRLAQKQLRDAVREAKSIYKKEHLRLSGEQYKNTDGKFTKGQIAKESGKTAAGILISLAGTIPLSMITGVVPPIAVVDVTGFIKEKNRNRFDNLVR